MQLETQLDTIQNWLIGEQWENVAITGDENGSYQFTISSQNYRAIKTAAQALAGTLTAYGDFNLIGVTAIKDSSGIIGYTINATGN